MSEVMACPESGGGHDLQEVYGPQDRDEQPSGAFCMRCGRMWIFTPTDDENAMRARPNL